MRRRHDPFLKRLYRAGTPDAIPLFFPELAAHIDWNHWKWIDKEILIRARRPRSLVADLVAETRDVDGRYMRVLLHPELQMQPDLTMDWRAFLYNAGLLLREGEPDVRVLTVVFYHCAGTGGVQKRRASLDFYGEELNGLTYWSVGLGDLDAEDYAARNNPMGWALASWMRQQRDERVELRLRLINQILSSVANDDYQELLLDTIQTYYKLSPTEQLVEERLLRSTRYGEVEEMAQTVLGRMRAQERRDAMREAVVQAILTRFPDAPTDLTARVEKVRSLAAIQELHRGVILAASLGEVERLLSG